MIFEVKKLIDEDPQELHGPDSCNILIISKFCFFIGTEYIVISFAAVER